MDDNVTFSIDGEIHYTSRRKVQRFPDLFGDGDLAFAG
jgi:hypothetical protein